MTWAMRRRLIILGIIAVVAVIALAAFYFLTLHRPASCVDNKQNQDEEGIDCGGSRCTYLCTASQAQPSVRFVRPVSPGGTRTDVIAYIDNPNSTVAAKNLQFTVELYSPENVVLASKQGNIDLPPSSTVPIFVPDLFSGSEEVARAFVTFNMPQHLWYRYQDLRAVPQVKDLKLSEGGMPRVTATASNPTAKTIPATLFVATLFDQSGNAIAASQTVSQAIPGLGSAPLVFTWPASFSAPVSRIEVIPVVPLPKP